MQNEKNNIKEENVETQNNNDKQKINENTDAEMNYETLLEENKKLRKTLHNINYTYHNVFIPLMIYMTAFCNDLSDKNIVEFCKIINMEAKPFKEILQKTKKCCGLEVKEIIKKLKDKEKDKDKKQKNKVGYKNPPVETRFQKGNKGNPKGRKSKKDANLLDLFEDELKKRIAINKNGKKKTVYKKELVIQQMLNQLMTGARVPKNNINIIKLIDKYVNSKKSLMRILDAK